LKGSFQFFVQSLCLVIVVLLIRGLLYHPGCSKRSTVCLKRGLKVTLEVHVKPVVVSPFDSFFIPGLFERES